MLKRIECDTYLTTARRHRWRLKMTMKNDKSNVAFSRHCGLRLYSWWRLQCRLKATFDLSFFIIFNLQRCLREVASRCHTLSFFLTQFLSLYLSRFSFYINNFQDRILSPKTTLTVFSNFVRKILLQAKVCLLRFHNWSLWNTYF